MQIYSTLEPLESRIALAAEIFSWDGGGGDERWSTPENWSTDIAPPSGAALVFPLNVVRPSNINDYPPATEFASISIATGSSFYQLGGNELVLTEGIHVSGPNWAALRMPIKLAADQTFSTESSETRVSFGYDPAQTLDLNGYRLTLTGPGYMQFDNPPFVDSGAGGEGTLIHTGEGTIKFVSESGPTALINDGGSISFFRWPGTDASVGGGSVEFFELGAITATGGTLRPGYPDSRVEGDLTLRPGSRLVESVAFNFNGAGNYLLNVIVTGTVDLGGAGLFFGTSARPIDGEKLVLIVNDGTDPVIGTFAGLPEGTEFEATRVPGEPPGVRFRISYGGGDGNDVELTAILPQVTISDDGKSASFFETDGDLVTIRTTVGTLDPRWFTLVPGGSQIGGFDFRSLDIGNFQPALTFASLSIEAAPSVYGGDGHVNVERVNISSQLQSFSLDGDLGSGQLLGISHAKVRSIGASAMASDFHATVSFSNLDKLKVHGDIRNAAVSAGRIETLTVHGDIRKAAVSAYRIEKLTVGGSLLGGADDWSGSIQSSRGAGTIVIGGDIRGGTGAHSGSIDVGTGEEAYRPGINSMYLKGSLLGGFGTGSGTIVVAGSIQRLLIGGSIVAGQGTNGSDYGHAGVIAGFHLGDIRIRGSVVGTPYNTVVVAAEGEMYFDVGPPAIDRLKVRGDFVYTKVLAGYAERTFAQVPRNADASINSMKVGGDWHASTVMAGVGPGADLLNGTSDDRKLTGVPRIPAHDTANIFSRIGSIIIRGEASGTEEGGDSFGIVAEQIDRLQVGDRSYDFDSGPHDRSDVVYLGDSAGPDDAPSDLAVREIAG